MIRTPVLLRLLKLSVDATLFLQVLGMIFIVLYAIVIGNQNEITLKYRGDFAENIDDPSYPIASKNTNYHHLNLFVKGSYIKFRADDSFTHLLLYGTVLLRLFYSSMITVLLRKFLRTVNENPFVLKNVKRLRIVGVLIFAITPLGWLIDYLKQIYLAHNFELTYPTLTNTYAFSLSEFAIPPWILTGLLILLIAEVFRFGILLKRDQELMI